MIDLCIKGKSNDPLHREGHVSLPIRPVIAAAIPLIFKRVRYRP